MTSSLSWQYNRFMVIEAVEERYGGLIKRITDLGPEIEEARRGSYQDPDNPSITYAPRSPHVVTQFVNRNIGGGGLDIHTEAAYARTPDTVVQTVFELDSLNGGRTISAKRLRREQINEANLTSGGWRGRTTWRWRP